LIVTVSPGTFVLYLKRIGKPLKVFEKEHDIIACVSTTALSAVQNKLREVGT
jgi:hypothetical protein